MTIKKDREADIAQQKRATRLLHALDGRLVAAIAKNGGELVGLTLKFTDWDCLMVLKAEFPGGRQVAFCGGESIVGCALKELG